MKNKTPRASRSAPVGFSPKNKVRARWARVFFSLSSLFLFGLSSDYEVFVVSRIKEEYSKNGDARRAVQRGTGLSARVVTAAALIMFSIFVAFMFTNDPTIKAIGFSFAVGVFLNAFVVRLTLVPATMAIIGAKLWYHPRWFARYVPDPDIEGQRLEHELTEGELALASGIQH